MYRIILVDDEPLILAGIASLITWEDYGYTIIGKATNGHSAYEMIMELRPDIVITDIRMPVLNGLQLVENCQVGGYDFPFIMLTNLEEFHLVKKALELGASGYLMKLELTPDKLLAALDRAGQACDMLVKYQNAPSPAASLPQQYQHYFKHLLIAGDSTLPAPDGLAQRYSCPFIVLFCLSPERIHLNQEEISYDFGHVGTQILDILSGICSRFLKASTLLQYNSNTYLLVSSLKEPALFEKAVKGLCTKIRAALKAYFELTGVFGVSHIKDTFVDLPTALAEAAAALEYHYYDSSDFIVFYNGQVHDKEHSGFFNINSLKKDLTTSVLLNDAEKLADAFTRILNLFAECKPDKDQAASACIQLYIDLYTLFENEDNTYLDIFPYTNNIAGQLNHFNSLAEILSWLELFGHKLARLLNDRKEVYSDKLVTQAKQYIHANYQEKLTLAEVAEAINISAGYLSSTFRKYAGITISDYIANVKIEHAQELIDSHQFWIYEVAEQLGFENAYYFSKVFKKVTGISPREYEAK